MPGYAKFAVPHLAKLNPDAAPISIRTRQVLLSTHTAAKVEGIKVWIHVSRLNKIPLP